MCGSAERNLRGSGPGSDFSQPDVDYGAVVRICGLLIGGRASEMCQGRRCDKPVTQAGRGPSESRRGVAPDRTQPAFLGQNRVRYPPFRQIATQSRKPGFFWVPRAPIARRVHRGSPGSDCRTRLRRPRRSGRRSPRDRERPRCRLESRFRWPAAPANRDS